MKGLTFEELINKFLEGDIEGISGGSGNLKIKRNQLIHYNTVIAERYGDKILVNVSRYSILTSKVQRYLRDTIPPKKIIEVHMVPKNYTDDLATLVKNQSK